MDLSTIADEAYNNWSQSIRLHLPLSANIHFKINGNLIFFVRSPVAVDRSQMNFITSKRPLSQTQTHSHLLRIIQNDPCNDCVNLNSALCIHIYESTHAIADSYIEMAGHRNDPNLILLVELCHFCFLKWFNFIKVLMYKTTTPTIIYTLHFSFKRFQSKHKILIKVHFASWRS